MVHAAAGRCTALHYGTYDYSAFCGIAAEYQSMAHPVADHAKLVMQAAAAGTGVRLSDGSTNILPVGDADAVRAGWRLHLRLVRRSLERGYYQGWDLHPAQLPTPLRRDLRLLPRRACARPPAGCAATSSGPPPASSTSRPPRARWPTICCAASELRRRDARGGCTAGTGLTLRRSPPWPGRAVDGPAGVPYGSTIR